MKAVSGWVLIILAAFAVASCAPAGRIWPSDRIGPMWVNRYGHTNSQLIWDYCNDEMTGSPGVQTVDCTVPWTDELFIGHGIYAEDAAQRDALWDARTWELSIDGNVVDLPAFNIADFDSDLDGRTYKYRLWRIRLRGIPEGVHILHYVMHVNREVENDPQSQPPGTYELIVNFTFEERQGP